MSSATKSQKTDTQGAKQPPVWNCQLSNSRNKDVWTVGDRKTLRCQGEAGQKLAANSAHLVFPQEKLHYTLHVLEAEVKGASTFEFVVTSYKPGQYSPKFFEITDGQNTYRVFDTKWEVQSVLEGQQQKPYDAFGPHVLSLPWWYWAAWIVPMALIVFGVIRLVMIRYKRRQLLQEIEERRPALSPYNNFNKEIRKSLRAIQGSVPPEEWPERVSRFAQELYSEFQSYLQFELKIRATSEPPRQILKQLKRYQKAVYNDMGRDIRTALRELELAANKSQKLQKKDCDQLVNMTRRIADRLQKRGVKSA